MPREVITINTPIGDVRYLSTNISAINKSTRFADESSSSTSFLKLRPLCSHPILFFCICLSSLLVLAFCGFLITSTSSPSSSSTPFFETYTPTAFVRHLKALDPSIRNVEPYSSSSYHDAQCQFSPESSKAKSHPHMKILSNTQYNSKTIYNRSEDFRQLNLDMLIPSRQFTSSHVLDPWVAKLTPVYAEPGPEYAILQINAFLMAGLGHLPPFYSGLPCIAEMQQSNDSTNPMTYFPYENCTFNQLEPLEQRTWYLQITTLEDKNVFLELGIATRSTTLAQAKLQLVEKFSLWNQHPTTVPLLEKLSTYQQFSDSFHHRHFINHLKPCTSYTIIVQLHNTTHITQPFEALTLTTLPAPQLHELERRRVTAYLNHITHPDAQKVPLLALRLEPTSEISIHRQPAPFENINEKCSPAFHKWVEDYQDFHAERISVFRNIRDIDTFRAELAKSKMIISAPKIDSGITDRTNGITSLFLMAMLSRRVLLLDETWPDIYSLFVSSLHLRQSINAPISQQSYVRKSYWAKTIGRADTVGLDFLGPVSDDYELTHPYPLIYYTNMRGITVEMLNQSALYTPLLKEMNLTVETISGCIWHKLWVPRLTSLTSDSSVAPVIATLLRQGVTGIGVQMRSVNDKAFASIDPKLKASDIHLISDQRQVTELDNSNATAWLNCASNVTQNILSQEIVNAYTKDSNQIVEYFISDDSTVRVAAIARYGKEYFEQDGTMKWPDASLGKVRKPPFLISTINTDNIGHISLLFSMNQKQTQMGQYALSEQFIFQLCHFHIISRDSGFGRVPSFGAMRGLPLYVIDQTDPGTSYCTPNATQPLKYAALEWSKV